MRIISSLRHLLVCAVLSVAVFASCGPVKDIAYLQNKVIDQPEKMDKHAGIVIQSKDMLSIVVSSRNPELVVMFNLPMVTLVAGSENATNSSQKVLGYVVDNEGYIDYPGLGKLKVNGLTTRECEALMRDELQKYLNEAPISSVRVSNFKVSVLGEVNKPGTFLVTDEQINVFQALALAGDMTLFSRRQDVQLMRADANGKVNTIHLDLTDANITASPYFYLQQNDILYVTPNKSKAKNSDVGQSTSLWFSVTSVVASILTILATILY